MSCVALCPNVQMLGKATDNVNSEKIPKLILMNGNQSYFWGMSLHKCNDKDEGKDKDKNKGRGKDKGSDDCFYKISNASDISIESRQFQ